MIKLKNDKECWWFLFGLVQLTVGLSYSIGFGGFLIGMSLTILATTFVDPPD